MPDEAIEGGLCDERDFGVHHPTRVRVLGSGVKAEEAR